MHVARRRFGQHFLHDPGVIQRIVAAIDPRPGERVVEIGPGLGAITLPLLARLPELHAVEIDRDAIRHLREATAGNIGCMMQIGSGTGVPVVHTVELLDWATGGPVPPALRRSQSGLAAE